VSIGKCAIGVEGSPGGWLRIESAPGAGTPVEFWIPDTPVPVDEDARTDEAAA
jgi:hypothetical protein